MGAISKLRELYIFIFCIWNALATDVVEYFVNMFVFFWERLACESEEEDRLGVFTSNIHVMISLVYSQK